MGWRQEEREIPIPHEALLCAGCTWTCLAFCSPLRPWHCFLYGRGNSAEVTEGWRPAGMGVRLDKCRSAHMRPGFLHSPVAPHLFSVRT